MKLIALLMIAVLALSVSAVAADVSRNMPARVSAGESITVTLTANNVPAGQLFTIEDQVPQGWRVSNWNVQGVDGGREAVEYRFVAADNRPGWSFTAASSSVTITYDVQVPANAANQDYSFDAVYFDANGQGRSPGTTTVRTIACGDGICEGGENSDSCVADCPLPAEPAPTQPSEPAPEESSEGGRGATTIIFAVVIVALLVAFFLYTKRKPAAPKK